MKYRQVHSDKPLSGADLPVVDPDQYNFSSIIV